jgi:hypothetical protein
MFSVENLGDIVARRRAEPLNSSAGRPGSRTCTGSAACVAWGHCRIAGRKDLLRPQDLSRANLPVSSGQALHPREAPHRSAVTAAATLQGSVVTALATLHGVARVPTLSGSGVSKAPESGSGPGKVAFAKQHQRTPPNALANQELRRFTAIFSDSIGQPNE